MLETPEAKLTRLIDPPICLQTSYGNVPSLVRMTGPGRSRPFHIRQLSSRCVRSAQFERFVELGERAGNLDGLPWFHTYQWNHIDAANSIKRKDFATTVSGKGEETGRIDSDFYRCVLLGDLLNGPEFHVARTIVTGGPFA